ncbi:MAG: N-acetylneuraminate synthase family protein [Halodesulfovibrio sp.]|uniref:N-acetylneuraminate synthase family protein n=1 Tax=Halodesulfovibrio sp. TaxID=1912772 RepID=UPI00359DADE4
MKIGNCDLNDQCMIIAEVGQAHEGSLGTAYAYVDAVAETGANAIKFQTHIASEESTKEDKFRVNFSKQDATRYDYWNRMEFTREQWVELANYSRSKGLVFLSTAFSNKAVDILYEASCPAWKVGSGDLLTLPLLDKMVEKGGPILLSTGMASWKEVDEVYQHLVRKTNEIAIFQCTTDYPCLPTNWGLNNISAIRERYNVPVGFSDHSGEIYSGLAAATVGVDLLEVHVVFSKKCFGPDTKASLTIEDLASLVKGVRKIETAKKHPVDKDKMSAEKKELKTLFSRSIVAARKLKKGHVITNDDLQFKKPNLGIDAKYYKKVIGRIVLDDVEKDQYLSESELK